MGKRLEKATKNPWVLVAEPVGRPVVDFALRVDAPLDLLPQKDAGFYCDAAMGDWLRRFGTETTPYHGRR